VRVLGEVVRPLGVLKIFQPVGEAEVEQVDDRHDPKPPHLLHDRVQFTPHVLPAPDEDPVDRRAVAEVAQAELADELQVGLPQLVMAGVAKLVDADVAFDRRVGALDAHAEHEPQRINGIGDANGGR
jgi:hypothetical protein